MKKPLLWILILIVSVSMIIPFAACAGEAAPVPEEEAEEEPAVTEETAEESEGEKEPVTLKFVGWEASPLETESVRQGLDIFMSKNPNITVEYNPIPGEEYTSKILTMMMAKTAPDVFFCYAYDYRSFARAGNLLDITDEFNEVYNLDDYVPPASTIMNIDNKVYGIISCIVCPVIYYNKDIFDEAGLDYPPSDPAEAWTWDEFVDVAKKLTKVENGKVVRYGVYGLENMYNYSALIMSNGGKFWDDNNNITKTMINSPETAEVLQAIYDLAAVENATTFLPDQMQQIGGSQSATNLLKNGNIAMLIDGSWSLQEISQMDFNYGMGVLPKFKEAITHGQAHVHSAGADTEHPDEAWQLINFLSSDDYLLLNVRAGLWLPHKKEYYTEEGVAKWYNPDVHPEGFTDMAPYFANSVVEPMSMNTNLKVNDIFLEELGKFFTGAQPVDVTLANIEQRANEEFASSK
ncbi:MAG: sugar ABC transporter substrate-binding protein [Actinomycetota bacterium]|nr:sugar ABC transporter substrate-binding protein [Actinomycetota bacterium]